MRAKRNVSNDDVFGGLLVAALDPVVRLAPLPQELRMVLMGKLSFAV